MSQIPFFRRRFFLTMFSIVGVFVLVLSSFGMKSTIPSVAAQSSTDEEPVFPGATLTSNGMLISFVEKVDNADSSSSWVYEVEELAGAEDMSGWVLGTGGCIVSDTITDTYELVDPDPSTGVRGVKWETTPDFQTGLFTVTVAQSATMGMVRVAAKAPKVAYGELTGPVCENVDTEDDGEIGTIIYVEEIGFVAYENVKVTIILDSGREVELKIKYKVDKHGKIKIKYKFNFKGKYKIRLKGEKSKKIVLKDYEVVLVTPEIAPDDTSDEPDYCAPGIFHIWFFNNEKMEGTPITAGCDDSKLHFRWGKHHPFSGVVDDEFSAYWIVKSKMKKGRKKLRLLIDDGVRISINGKTVLSSWQLNPASIYERDFYIPVEGTYTIRVEYFEHHHVAAIQTLWCDDVDNCPNIVHPVGSALQDYDPVEIPVGDIVSDDAPPVFIPSDARMKEIEAVDWNTPAGGEWTTDITDLAPTNFNSTVYLPVLQN